MGPIFRLPVVLAIAFPIILTGCSTSFDPPALTTAQSPTGALAGGLHGGRQAVTGASVYLFAAGTSGYPVQGEPTVGKSVSLLTSAGYSGYPTQLDSDGNYYVTSDANGGFILASTCTVGTQIYVYAVGGNPGLGAGQTNSAAGFLAALGQCPASGDLASTISHIYMNEVSTIAAAYAFAGFAVDATHVSSSGTSLAQTGIANAFANAASLYNIQAAANANGAAFASANSTTVNGNGAVPQQLINSLANSLAACVNSTGPASSQCTQLFRYTSSSGASGAAPTDTATAAINLAHNPWPTAAGVTAIFDLPNNQLYPFTPYLPANKAPVDFTIGITYTAGFTGSYSVAIDSTGNAWVVNDDSNSVVKLSPLGVPTTITSGGIDEPQAIAIDGLGNAWVTNATSVTKITGTTGANYPVASSQNAGYIAVDKSNTIWLTTYGGAAIDNLTQTGTTNTGPYTYPNGTYGVPNPTNLAVDSTNRIWAVDSGVGGLLSLTNPGSSATLAEYPEPSLPQMEGSWGIAIDSSNNIWGAGLTASGDTALAKVNSSGSLVATYTEASLDCYAPAIDGAGNIWITNLTNNENTSGIVEFSNSGTLLSSPAGYEGGDQQEPLSIAIDGSGNIWLPGLPLSGTSTNVVELIGAAVPVVTPISPIYPNGTTTGLGVRP
jgi:hypothetical protein